MARWVERLRGLLGGGHGSRAEVVFPPGGLQPGSAPPRPSAADTSAHQSNEFAVALYAQLLQRPGNIFFSPFSLRVALALAQAGARGETAVQMREALRIASAGDAADPAIDMPGQRLTAARQYEFAMANSLWVQQGETIQPEFRELIAGQQYGVLNAVDFRGGAEAARTTINTWVEDTTRRRIQGLIPPGGLAPETRLVLANAVYLKATWVLPFDAWRTRDASFHLASGGTVRVPLMSQRAHVWYVEGGGFQAVDLDYRGGDLSMLVLLPDDANGLPDLEARLSARVLQDCVEAMRMTEVRLFLPRFKLTWSADVCAPLRELGMALAFTAFQADFSGINGEQPPSAESLFLAAAYHKAFLDVHEMGTEAAAATMVGVTLGFSPGAERLPVPVFRADHRFLVVIRERRSGAILFLGRVENPAGDDV